MRENCSTSRKVAGAFFQTRVGTPRMTTSAISKRWPGAVSRLWASAKDMAGQWGLPARVVMYVPWNGVVGRNRSSAPEEIKGEAEELGDIERAASRTTLQGARYPEDILKLSGR